jgi:hypothetical protein
MKIEAVQKVICENLNISEIEALKILEKAKAGQEFIDDSDVEEWLEERFLPNIVLIDENGYEKMCIEALKKSATDYGSSRQRDFGQLWGDMTRGYLAEYAFVLFLEKVWGIKADLGHESGNLKDYLPCDIHTIQKTGEIIRKPNLNIGIKGTKWNGIWLDIPNNQFNHSDIHILVKVGVSRDHLFAYFRHISVFKDKILKKGIEIGCLDQTSANILFDDLPSFKPIVAYISGFAMKDKEYKSLDYSGKKGRKNFTIKSWNGQYKETDLAEIKKLENINGKVEFEGIGTFSHNQSFLFNVGNLLWKKEDWEKHLINKI